MPFAESKREKKKLAASQKASPEKNTAQTSILDLQTVGTTTRPNIIYDASGPDGVTVAPKRKQASVVEMLEYVKGLDIDPLKEADMLWIAEEAFNAPLPPGWSEHQDERGRLYFHNTATGKSEWRHPMDDVFKEVVMYQRRVVADDGFWNIEDEIASREEAIRRDLADWMELFDENTEKFFYNRRTDESRFDDPRMEKYHELYARIKMVAKMKERLPQLARNARPKEPTAEELEAQSRAKEEEERYLKMLIRIQSMARVIIARKKVKQAVAQAEIQKGPQPLRGKLRLRMERVGGARRELVLAQTTPHRRDKAATKIQARIRGVLARKRFRPLVLHRRYLSKMVTKVQNRVRIWIARRRVARMKHARRMRAATTVQKVFRGYRDRKFLKGLTIEKVRFNHMVKKVVVIQSGCRMRLATKEVARQRLARKNRMVSRMQARAHTFLAQRKVHDYGNIDYPIHARFVITKDASIQGFAPFHFQMLCAPSTADETLDANGSFVDIFSKFDPEQPIEFSGKGHLKKLKMKQCHVQAITKVQAMARGVLQRGHKKERVAYCLGLCRELEADVYAMYYHRKHAATKIQKIVRGRQTRQKDLIRNKMTKFFDKNVVKIKAIQALMRKSNAQQWLREALYGEKRDKAATVLQARWRGQLARSHFKRISEEVYWPLKSWFEFNSTKAFVDGQTRDTVQLQVRFVANPRFDDFKHFETYGDSDELILSVQDMADQVNFSIEEFLATSLSKQPSEESKVPAVTGLERTTSTSQPKSPVSKSSTSTSKPKSPKPTSPKPKSSPRTSAPPARKEEQVRSKSKQLITSNSEEETRETKPRSPSRSPVPSPRQNETVEVKSTRLKPLDKEDDVLGDESSTMLPGDSTLSLTTGMRTTTTTLGQATTAQATMQVAIPDTKVTIAPATKQPTKARPTSGSTSDTDSKKEDRKLKVVSGDHSSSRVAPEAKSTTKHRPSREPPSREPSKSSSGYPPETVDRAEREDRADREDRVERELPPVLAPVRKLNVAPRERVALFENGLESEALKLFKEAQKKYKDQKPPGCPITARRKEYDLFKQQKKEAQELERQRLMKGKSEIPNVTPGIQKPPDIIAPSPPPEDRDTNEIKAAQIKLSQSDGALQGVKPLPPPVRQSYGGKLVGGTFVKSNAETVNDMTDAEIQECMADIAKLDASKRDHLAQKKHFHKQRKRHEEQKKQDKFRSEMDDAETAEEERRKKKVKELKKWLKQKEADARAKKEREQAMMQEVLQKEQMKTEAFKEIEKKRVEEREKRLRIGEMQRAKLEAQMSVSRGEKARSLMSDPVSKLQTPTMSQAEFTTQPQKMMVPVSPEPSLGMQLANPMGAMPQLQPPLSDQRVVHRHIHHHVHYHEGNGVEGQATGPPGVGAPFVSVDEQKQLEATSEARVRSQLEQAGPLQLGRNQSEHLHQHIGIPRMAVDPGAETPTNNSRRAHSMGALVDGADRTQEAFHRMKPSPLGDDLHEIGKKRGLEKYAGNVNRAFGSYADSGRPRMAQHLPSSLPSYMLKPVQMGHLPGQ